MLFAGLDLGTSGVRVTAVDEHGKIAASASRSADFSVACENGVEQDPEAWWRETLAVLGELAFALKKNGRSPEELSALGVTSTSGTLVVLDKKLRPLRPAIMYSDVRAADAAKFVQNAGRAHASRHGYAFNASFAITKAAWLASAEPETFGKAAHFVHPADFIVGRLAGELASDYSTSLKMGYDLLSDHWPGFIARKLGISSAALPRVVAPGEPVGTILLDVAAQTGLSPATQVAPAGSDGVAAFAASGARRPGDWASSLGTTLVLKSIADDLVKDPDGRVYCHRHPDGFWIPGGASSTGAAWVNARFGDADAAALATLFNAASSRTPTGLLVYPLVGRGERFPFLNPEAEGFIAGRPADRAELFAAHMEGTAFVERWCLDVLAQLGAPTGGELFTVGGATREDAWLQIRANVLGRPLAVPDVPEATSFGAAVIAASKAAYGSLSEASEAMVRVGRVVEPREEAVAAYREKYRKFRHACAAIGYA